MADELEEVIQREGPDTIAGFVAEPVMGAGGVIVPSKGYFQALQPILQKYGIPMISDEVISGFGRTGNTWGCETFGLCPTRSSRPRTSRRASSHGRRDPGTELSIASSAPRTR
jgi:adenosylmethionine-8-amino-7-oxononanoate aminotransferase